MSERVFLFLSARLIVKRWLGRLMKLYCFSETRWKQIYSIVIWKDSECRVVWGFHQWRKKKIAKFVGEFINCRRIARVCLTILRDWHLNGLAQSFKYWWCIFAQLVFDKCRKSLFTSQVSAKVVSHMHVASS